MICMAEQEGTKPDLADAEASSVSLVLQRIQGGDASAKEDLFQMVYGQLRRMTRELMTREAPGHTLQASALVNEAYLKLERAGLVANAESRRHLFGSAARAMQQVLIDHARSRGTEKRGGNMQKHGLDAVVDQFEAKHTAKFLDLEAALDRLRSESARQHEALMLRFFGGLSVPEVAELMGHSVSTTQADWRIARAKLYSWLKE